MRIPFDDWRPDLADLDQSVSATAKNVIPSANSYRPIPSPSAYSDALGADPRGLWLAKTDAGDFEAWVATETAIYEYVGTTPTERGSGYTGPAAGENWAGIQFGTDFFWNNLNDGLLVFDIEGGSSVSAVSGSPPSAKYMDVFEEYLFHANTTNSPRELVCSDVNDGQTYGSGLSKTQTVPDGGAIVGLCGARKWLIQEQAIREVIMTGDDEVFNLNKIEQAKGSISPESIIRFGETVAYLAEDGFWWNGQPIGQGSVNRYFLSQINQNNLYTVLGRLDPQRPLFWWHYRSADTATYDRAIIFNWQSGRWAETDSDLSILFAAESATAGLTLEQLSALYPNLEDIPYSLDSRVWLGGRPVYAVIDTDRKLAFLEGPNLAATVETGKRQLIPNRRSKVLGARPLVDASGATLAVGKRNVLSAATSWGSAISQQNSGIVPFNASARVHQFRLGVPAGQTWTHAQGVEIPEDRLVPESDR